MKNQQHYGQIRRCATRVIGTLAIGFLQPVAINAQTAGLPLVKGVEAQPLAAQIKRVAEALEYLGVPLSDSERQSLEKAAGMTDSAKACEAIQQVLDPRCLAGITINPEMRVKASQGPAKAELLADGWRTFL